MSTITITSKRQATLPLALCREIGVGPGDKLDVERATIGDETVWVLRAGTATPKWFGSLRRYGEGKPHDRGAIAASVAKGRAAERDE